MAATSEPSLDFPVYSIKAVAQMAGVSEPTLRAWEKRYSILTPQRTDSGHRRYTRRDILRVIWLRQRIEEGIAISQASALLQSQGDLDLMALSQLANDNPVPPLARRNGTHTEGTTASIRSPEALSDDLLQAFLEFDETRADNLLSEANGLYSLETVCVDIIQPVMHEIGERWLRNELTVANEHFATNICRLRINAMIESLPVKTAGPLIITACAPQEFHEIGILTTTFFMRRNGWRVIYLGQNVPAVDLEKDLVRLKPALVCFSATRTETALTLAREIAPVIARVRAVQPGLVFAYGGRAFVEEPDLHNLMGGATYFGDDAIESASLVDRVLETAAR